MPWKDSLTMRFGGRNAKLDLVRRLSHADNPGGVGILASALRDCDAEIQEQGAWGLAYLAGTLLKGASLLGGEAANPAKLVHDWLAAGGAIDALRCAAATSNVSLRRQAVEALGRGFAVEALPDLIRLLAEDPDPRVREACAEALGRLGERQAVGSLTRALAADADMPVRLWCVRSLGDLRDACAVPALAAALRDENQEVRNEARFALRAIGGTEAQQVLGSGTA